jgi:hypothetical protein
MHRNRFGRVFPGGAKRIAAIAGLAPSGERTEPDSGAARRYDALYGVYRSLYPALLSQQHALARFPSGD